MTSSVLSVRDLSFAYNGPDTFSLFVPSFDLYAGEKVAIIGPNGAGKTTFLQAIALLLKPATGTIIFDAKEIRNRHDTLGYHRLTAFIPQKPVLYNRSVKDNVSIGLKIRGTTKAEADESVSGILKKFRIEHLANRNALKVSGGEARRIMLARGLILNPMIVWMDEPFGDLDETVRRELIEDLIPILSQSGCATVFVTHNQDETYQLADKFMVMVKGKIVQSGSGQEVFANPASREVAEFIGIKNIIPGRVVKTDNGIVTVSLMTGTAQSPKTLLVAGQKPNTENVVVCIPPESIVIVSDIKESIHSSSRNALEGAVKRIIQGRYFAWVEIDCGVPLTVSVTNESVKDLGLAPGKPVRLLIKSTAIRLLEK
ncbi:MAG: ABC transporter ATP-binding protein [Planctomycetes bacterium]|nr:ABC transporter ATP-binding protein [Planctomycetota bacterium]